jgi:NAD(P)H-hydrate epimerase
MGITGYWLTEGSRLNVARMALWSSDIAIDAIFGTGLNDNVTGTALAVINILNESNKPVISCDIPSGLSSLTGLPLGVAIKATRTVAFGFYKIGLVLPSAAPYVGELVLADISLPIQVEEHLNSRRELIDKPFCRRWLLPRNKESHKGDYGHLLMLAGSPAMPGAAILAAKAALKTGAGKVSAVLPKECHTMLIGQVPEAMLLPVEENNDGLMNAKEIKKFSAFEANSVLIGPGLGRSEDAMQLVRDLLPVLSKPTVLDADALFAVCGYQTLLKEFSAPLVITPHPGEFAKLLGVNINEVQKDRLTAAEEFAKKWNVVVVLKGAGTIIATPEGRSFVNIAGNPGMATAGSGDVLSGMIATLLAQGLPPAAAAACAVWLHGRAGDIAAANLSEAGIVAGDIINYIGKAMLELN